LYNTRFYSLFAVQRI